MMLLLSLALAAQLDTFPVGSRVWLEIDGERQVTLQAKGPSVLWIRATSPGLTMLRVSTGHSVASAPAVGGTAECIVPVYGEENVSVIINAASQNNVLLLGFYGIGDAVSDPRKNLSISLPVAAPLPPTLSMPIAEVAPVARPIAVPVEIADQSKNDPSIIPLSDFRTSLYFGQIQSGFIAPPQNGVTEGVATFRLYVPNRQAFEVIVTGQHNVRVRSEATGTDFGAFGTSAIKRVTVPGPTHGYYLISIQGSGEYSVQAQNAD